MIYRHYKGGIYFLEGCASYVNRVQTHEKILEIFSVRHTEYDIDFPIMLLEDKATSGNYYAFGGSEYKQDGDLIFYRDIYGKFWGRPRDMFFGKERVTWELDGRLRKAEDDEVGFYVKRFEHLDYIKVFDFISKELQIL